MVDPFRHIANLVADRALRYRVIGVAGHLNDFSVLFMEQQTARIGTIQRAHRGKHPVWFMDHVPPLLSCSLL
ncbi:hypothetical protein D3C81_928500 [compost metagenome]